jgi:hypothetical protein
MAFGSGAFGGGGFGSNNNQQSSGFGGFGANNTNSNTNTGGKSHLLFSNATARATSTCAAGFSTTVSNLSATTGFGSSANTGTSIFGANNNNNNNSNTGSGMFGGNSNSTPFGGGGTSHLRVDIASSRDFTTLPAVSRILAASFDASVIFHKVTSLTISHRLRCQQRGAQGIWLYALWQLHHGRRSFWRRRLNGRRVRWIRRNQQHHDHDARFWSQQQHHRWGPLWTAQDWRLRYYQHRWWRPLRRRRQHGRRFRIYER